MENKQDKEFWKQMKEVEKKKAKIMFGNQPSSPEPEKPKKKNRYRQITGGILVGLMAVYGVLAFIPDKEVPAISQIEELPANEVNEKELHLYLQKIEGLSDHISHYSNEILATSNVKKVKELKERIKYFKEEVKTESTALQPLKDYYLDQIALMEEMADLQIENKGDLNLIESHQLRELKKEYNANFVKEQEIFIALLEKSGMYYKVQEDGSLYYRLSDNETN
ncbi:hypothetical protein CVD28_00725 [Bacillus sp. M6-12]|uniref:hypothetical protein n=1 Tax=Bacillus sp. M6-12 TaxID=2054166 RepID=UPI000C776B27|nr:hypothetical protein [Bacillus sp. M6-12]PLS18957.1 hypothetical protein CVD28_00725 [Bacillus sp. M6-12]